ncbi:uncharacterized protein LOC131695118 [Topomyia yanbarensis]|uniref:uncharacterized protein LOC131694900 n=1 Tax=Topomyia yanbarensis TaxID=2498891 RepID=UPI00273A8835|nr:uncharacterized protein LOC131694900 [Topomyia yanbarensis]XP_058839619.1 uncharacterized protein LOC131695118 [Topomyia yanbarensis]
MKKANVCWFFFLGLLIQPSSAFFGLGESSYFAPSTDILTVSVMAFSTYSSIGSTANSLTSETFNSITLSDLATSFSNTFSGLCYQMTQVFTAIRTAATDKTTNIDTLFVTINATIANATTFLSSNDRTLWTSVLSSNTLPDLTITLLALQNISHKLNVDIYPKLIALRAANPISVSPATILASLPQTLLSEFSSTIRQLNQFESTITLPFIQFFVKTVALANSNLRTYISTMSSSYSTLDTTVRQSWATASLLPDTYTSSTDSLYQPVKTLTNSFIKLINTFTDLYLGSSAETDSSAVTMLINSYINNATEQTEMILAKLDNIRTKLSDQVLQSASNMLNVGAQSFENISINMLQKVNGISCASTQTTQSFINGYSAAMVSMKDCLSGANFDLTTPTNTQIKVASSIQADVRYYLQLLNGMLAGITNNSPVTTRIATDAQITAFFSQSSGIIQTFSQQLVNMYVQLGADYDLLVGRSSYCLARNDAGWNMLVQDFVSVFQQC